MHMLPLAFALLLPTAALADQTTPMAHSGMDHVAMMSSPPEGVTEGGQSAFAAIAEIVEVLSADPATDWSKVNIEALRLHLFDMDNVTLRAVVTATPTPTGARFTVTSTDAAVQGSIRRMVTAHAAATTGSDGWTMAANEAEGGAVLEVSGGEADAAMINGLGFIGVLSLGMHHQAHHLMIASGMNPHE